MDLRNIYRLFGILVSIVAFCTIVSCTERVPSAYENAKDSLSIYPDYKNVVIPKNISPLNFVVENKGDKYIASVHVNGVERLTVSSSNGEIRFPLKKWHELLEEDFDCRLSVNVFVQNKDKWYGYPAFDIRVVADSMDSYITYRLIEPSYVCSGGLALYQYHVEDAEEECFVGSHKFRSRPELGTSRCMNCHTSQRNHPENYTFQQRGPGGGMVMNYKGEKKIIESKVGDMKAGAVYERWHPTLPFIVFSNNSVAQIFPTKGSAKIEAFDHRSDILLYDIEKNEMQYLVKSPIQTTSYPDWSPDGKYIYYASTAAKSRDELQNVLKKNFNLMRVPFNSDTVGVGESELLFDAVSLNKSISKPRVSPDGRYVAMTISEYGGYHYTHKDADIVLFDLKDSVLKEVPIVNSPESDGYVTWSSNGRWMMIGSRREDGNYVRLYFSYFDRDGKAYKPFQMPHESPLYDRILLKCYNYPEFGKMAVDIKPEDVYNLMDDPTVHVTPNFKGKTDNDSTVDVVTGASMVSY